jgi:hypothetical protein
MDELMDKPTDELIAKPIDKPIDKPRPNKEYLKPFAPGVSGNPNGRPKGALNFRTRILRVLKELQADSKGHKSQRATALARKMVERAGGDAAMAKVVLELAGEQLGGEVASVSVAVHLVQPNITILPKRDGD